MAKKSNVVDLPNMEGPGVAPVRIAEVDAAASNYYREKEKRCKQSVKEIAAKRDLIDALHKHEDRIGRDEAGVLRYKLPDEELIVILRPAGEEQLSVKAMVEDGE